MILSLCCCFNGSFTATRRLNSPSPSNCDNDDESIIDETNITTELNGVSDDLENEMKDTSANNSRVTKTEQAKMEIVDIDGSTTTQPQTAMPSTTSSTPVNTPPLDDKVVNPLEGEHKTNAEGKETPMVKSDEGVNNDSNDTEKNTVEDLELHGISVDYLASQVLKEVVDAGLTSSSKIYELEDLSKLDINGLIRRKGAKKYCPIDKRKGAAYVHSIDNPNAVGRADIMLSYAWGYEIGDIVDTLQVYCADNGKNPKDFYVWICCLCVNQHRVIEMKKRGEDIPFDEFRSVFEKRVKKIGHIVAMMAPWQDPFYLTRIWCIFEMFTAQNNGCRITIAMPSGEKKRFIEGLTNDDGKDQVDTLFSTLAKTDVKKAEASVESDRTNILQIVEKGVGYVSFNMAVSGLLREWATGVVIGAVEEGKRNMEDTRSKERRNMEDESRKKRQGGLLNNVVRLLYDIGGNQDRGLLLAREALGIHEEVYGREDVRTARSLFLIGEGQWLSPPNNRDYDLSLKTLNEALGLFEVIHKGRQNEDAADVLFQIGLALNNKGDKDESLKVRRESLSIQEKLFGAKSIKTTKSRSGAAFLLGEMGEEDESLRLYEMNLEIQIECLGKDHPDTALTINNIGFAHYKKREFEKALEMFQAALVIYEKVFGNDHGKTKIFRRNVDGTTSKIKNNQS